jgi:predicted metal-dependent hydrolase
LKPSTHVITRSILINQQSISYNLRYSRKAKYIRLQISHGSNLELVLPRGYELADAEKFIKQKSDWITKHLRPAKEEDEKFLLLGKEIKIIQVYELFTRKHKLIFENNELRIVSPQGSKIDLKKLYDIWLKNFAKRYLPERAYQLAGKYGFIINKVSVRNQKTRWGSCSARGNLSFNFNLVQYKKEIIDYVIVHELCHRKEMNHSKKFWLLVEKICPDYKILRKELKKSSNI